MYREDTELLQVLATGAREGRTFSLAVTTDEGLGRIYVSHGEVVHAVYGHLVGEEAVQAMLDAPGADVETQAEARLYTPRSLPPSTPRSSPPRALALPPARARSSPHSDSSRPLPLAMTLARNSVRPVREKPAGRKKALLGVVFGSLALGAVAGWAYNAARVSGAAVNGGGVATPSVQAVRPEAPIVVVRLSIGADGRPVAARVSGSSLDQTLFEQAALGAARELEFLPATRGGVPVAVELDWPVSFRAEASPRTGVKSVSESAIR
jgi:TonB family protein